MTTTAPHITRSRVYTGIRTDCRLCGAHNTASGLFAGEDADNWATAHATTCSPDTVRQRATHYRLAAQHLDHYADADPDDGTDWNDPAIRAAIRNLRQHLYDTAYHLETAADDETETAPAASSGSVPARADGDPSS